MTEFKIKMNETSATDEIDFDGITNEVVKEHEEVEAKKNETKEAPKITDGWKKGPFIVAGIIAVVLIIGSLVFVNWPV